MKTTVLFVAILIICISSFAQQSQSENPANGNIIDTLAATGTFNTFSKALQIAGLVETLKKEGPFTVLAPTDEAFTKLPEGMLDALLKNPEKLKTLLNYHIIPQMVTFTNFGEPKEFSTLMGQAIAIKAEGIRFLVEGNDVLEKDFMCSNGIFHVIDKVLLPNDIIGALNASEKCAILLSAFEKAELIETLKGDGPFTVFAPTNDAFKKVPQAKLNEILGNKEKLKHLLTYHVVSGKILGADIVQLKNLKSLNGQTLTVTKLEDKIIIDNSKIEKSDLFCTNGVIHLVNAVMLPK